jgi:hydroxymethylbilane synthase
MKLGTRGSALALWQAHTVARLLLERTGTECEIVTIRTSGDERPGVGSRQSAVDGKSDSAVPDSRTADSETPDSRLPTADENTKRVFVKEIEDALLARRIDLAVHSAKDMSAQQPDGLAIGGVLPREDPRDALVLSHVAAPLRDINELLRVLGETPRLGTSSVRRSAQLRRILPKASFAPVRGNVETRLRKLDAGECDALVLAVAGLRRLNLFDRISLALPVDLCTPAPGQGIVAVQIRADDQDARAAVAAMSDVDAADALIAEQAVVRALGGGCHLPLGALARIEGSDLAIAGVVIAPDGSRAVRDERRGSRRDAVQLGDALAQALLAAGADEILRVL